MSAQRQRPIDFATEGLLLAHRVGRNCGIRVERVSECCIRSGVLEKVLVQNSVYMKGVIAELLANRVRPPRARSMSSTGVSHHHLLRQMKNSRSPMIPSRLKRSRRVIDYFSFVSLESLSFDERAGYLFFKTSATNRAAISRPSAFQ
jgi:hypothetical protein